jgi:S-adenosylmethionine:tRNA ribosyltransferase-isomerase
VLLSEFDYDLPEELIAQIAIEPRDSSRLLVARKLTSQIQHQHFFDLPDCLQSGDCLILNNSKVLPARLSARLANGNELEILLLSTVSPLRWNCLARPGRKIKEATRIEFPEGITATISRIESHFQVEFEILETEFLPWLHRVGELPLPPYISRKADASDRERYQTIYAKSLGSVAAPTAGLHFTPGLLERLRRRGIEIGEITLHVGYGTFAPIREEIVSNHKMHEEMFEISAEVSSLVRQTKASGKKVIAVGTTSLRALESGLASGSQKGATELFISPGYRFKAVDGLITNFHLPKTSLLVLVSALLGVEKTRACYAEAIRERYRFFSYGDAMAIL